MKVEPFEDLQQHFDHLLADAEEVARIIGGLRVAVERQLNEQRGNK